MSRKYSVTLRVDSADNVLVDAHQGKLMFDGSTKPLKAQKGVACTLAARDKLRTFFGKAADKSDDWAVKKGREAELLLKPVRQILSKPPINYAALATESARALEHLSYDPITEILKNPSFIKLKDKYNHESDRPLSSIQFYNTLSEEKKGQISYFTFLDIMDTQLGFSQVNWKISDGFAGLQESLRLNGQIIFQGKFGACFHTLGSILPHRSESQGNREVHFFKRGTFQPAMPWTHCVVVDQAKLIDEKPYIFFRDTKESIPGKPEKVYILSYENFVGRLSDKYGNKAQDNEVCGMAREADAAEVLVCSTRDVLSLSSTLDDCEQDVAPLQSKSSGHI